jgi:adenylate cyclase
MNAPRKLAAILAADVAGYSRLTGLDEEGTLKRLRKLRRELINPAVALHRGRIVKITGDGILIEFPSVVEAVRCAVDVQRGMDGRNADVPAERRIEFRVGINVGDVVVEGEDLLGDGVNVAARLEGIAEAGGICISEDAYRQVRDKLNVRFEDAGEQQLKNIARPVRTYRVRIEGEGSTTVHPLTLPDRPSIAVMAFINMSGDPEQEHFGDGIAEDITTALSKLRWLFVIARNSSFIYKSRPTDVKQIGRELGVRYILEGSVRKAGNHVRINSQLIDVITGAHVWAERYDRKLTDLFAVQDEITSSVASEIGPALAEAERQRVMRKAPESLDVWEAYHRGFWHFLKQEPAENENAKIYFQRAIAIDPNFGSGYCGLALTHLWDAWLYHKRSFPECVTVARPKRRHSDHPSDILVGYARAIS